MQLQTETLTKVVKDVLATRPDEMDCGSCHSQIDSFVEMLREGKKASEVKPLVKHHLDMCGDCNEEFQALLQALEAADAIE